MNVKAAFAYCRMNPPTKGHARIVDKLREEARRSGGVARLYLSETQDKKRNPLTPAQKVAFAQALFPDVEVRLAKTLMEAGQAMAADGIDHAVMVVGADRKEAFEKILTTYAGTPDLGLAHAEVVAITRTDEEASATKARAAALVEDWKAFTDLAATTDVKLIREVYDAVRVGMGVS